MTNSISAFNKRRKLRDIVDEEEELQSIVLNPYRFREWEGRPPYHESAWSRMLLNIKLIRRWSVDISYNIKICKNM
jgi:hypothetical protein